ncbi:hypothetical protein V6Z11_A07G066800 [Gossypium hirsutum]
MRTNSQGPKTKMTQISKTQHLGADQITTTHKLQGNFNKMNKVQIGVNLKLARMGRTRSTNYPFKGNMRRSILSTLRLSLSLPQNAIKIKHNIYYFLKNIKNLENPKPFFKTPFSLKIFYPFVFFF